MTWRAAALPYVMALCVCMAALTAAPAHGGCVEHADPRTNTPRPGTVFNLNDERGCAPEAPGEDTPKMHVGIVDYGGGPSIHLVTDTNGVRLMLYLNDALVWSRVGVNSPGDQFQPAGGWTAGEYNVTAVAAGRAVSATFTYRPDVATAPGLYAGGDDGSPGSRSASGDDCTVYGRHSYSWDAKDPPRNNAPRENSLYPGDVVGGTYTWDSDGCCKVRVSGPDPDSKWSLVENPARVAAGLGLNTKRGTSYDQVMAIVPGELVPGASSFGDYIHTAAYDASGRSRTHQQGVTEGHGLVPGSVYTVKGYTYPENTDDPKCTQLSAKLVMRADFRYRTPFWETSIFEHHILDANGYPASNLDYSNYRHDAIPLEVGSNLVLGGYRWETIEISHKILSGDHVAAEFHCRSKTCGIELPAAPESAAYVGNKGYRGDAKNPPWPDPDPGEEGELDHGEAIFSIPASSTGEIRIMSTMTNDGIEVARGYNTTYQFVPSYEPVVSVTPVTNTALGGNSALDRPVSLVIEYNGTISDTIHYCTVGDAYDTNGTLIPYGSTGEADAWGRVAGDACPENRPPSGWGMQPPWCSDGSCGTYVVHPERPAAAGWGRWSAVNPETRALLEDFEGKHMICLDSECTTHDTPYTKWDFAPGTDRDFIPACVADIIAAEGGGNTNDPKPENWGEDKDWPDGPYTIGEGAEPHSYRGVFAAGPYTAPTHYVVDSGKCEYELGDRECVPRGAECKPEYDRRCESVFEPFLYPDDYIMSNHERLQGMVVEWCGPSPTEQCAREAYGVIDEVMVSLCTQIGIDYHTHNQVIDAGAIASGSGVTPNMCHNMVAVGVHAPAIRGVLADDWRACYGVVPEATDPPAVWPDGKPDGSPECHPWPGGTSISQPYWDGSTQNVYVPYTPSTGAFGGVVERPGNMLMDDGSLTCSCDDENNNGICDRAEAAGGGTDLDGNGIADDWDALTPDGAMKCLDRTGKVAAAVATCWAKHGKDAADGDPAGVESCMAAAGSMEDGPDGECDPAVVLGSILPDGTVSVDGLPAGWTDMVASGAHELWLSVPFLGVDGLIPIPYVVEGEHVYCDESEPWCITSGDTYREHERRAVCEDPEMPVSIKRIPAPATMPPLYQPVFDAVWPPECLPKYPVGNWSRPEHGVSLDLANMEAQWPTMPPPIPDMGSGRTPAHVSTDTDAGHTMMLHAGSGVVRFAACEGCEPPLTGEGEWTGVIRTGMGGANHTVAGTMQHPPYVVSQEASARVVAVEPCKTCDAGWRVAESDPGIHIILTAYPEMHTPVTEPDEMAAAGCQIDGDGGTGLLNSWSALFAGMAGGADGPVDFLSGMTCRDIPGISLTMQDYEAAKHGAAAKRESGQPWTVAEGMNNVNITALRNGIWLSTLSILEHRGQCVTYSWSQGITPGHTSCPATVQELSDCMSEGVDIGTCFDLVSGGGKCAETYAEDDIHKKWVFTEPPAGNVPVVYRMPNGSYAGEGSGGLISMDAGRLVWEPGGEYILRCEAAVGEDGELYGVERDLPADEVDVYGGGSFACQEVAACKSASTTYKCLGGEIVPHVVCDELADTYSVLDMPYETVMANVAAQMLHIEAACPVGHAHAGPGSLCDGRPIYDTHRLANGTALTTVYVDYFGVGKLGVGRGTPFTDTIHVRAPETFGPIHRMEVEWDGAVSDISPDVPCVSCVFEHRGAGRITVWNLYGGQLTADVERVDMHVISNVDVEDVWGAVWLYLPVICLAVAVYVVVWKYRKHFDIWDD